MRDGPGPDRIAGPDGGPAGALLRAALPEAHADVVGAIIRERSGDRLDLSGRTGAADPGLSREAVEDAARSFTSFFGVELLARPDRPRAAPDDASTGGHDPSPGELRLGDGFVDLLEEAHEPDAVVGPAPVVADDVAPWIAAIAGADVRGRGLHLGLRCRGDGDRDARDVAALFREAGVTTVTVESPACHLAAALLRAEIHDDGPAVVIVTGARLVEWDTTDSPDHFDEPLSRKGDATTFARSSAHWLRAMRRACVWLLPEDAVPPPDLDALLAGCIGPFRPEAAWSRRLVAEAVGAGAGPAGIAAITASVRDPRDAGARAAAARALAATGMGLDEACAFVARSLVPAAPAGDPPADFDPALVAFDGELALLFSRAREVALAAGRVLLTGPPGGGKSAFARALAARMADSGAAGPPVVVAASEILVRSYGGTERLLAQLWRRAGIARSPLVVDEIDAMCGVRDASGSSSGNAYLVRVLTDEWIRRFDAHPDVPVLATCNDPAAVDPAILRRFSARYAIGAELPPHLERRAWTSMLGVDPPASWIPCGAAPSDFAAARARCRMLGTTDAGSLAAAVAEARDARGGGRRAPGKPGRRTH